MDQPIITNINQLIYRNGTDRRFRQATGPCQSRGQTLHLDKTMSSLRFASHLRSKWLWWGRKKWIEYIKIQICISMYIYIHMYESMYMYICIYVYMYICIYVYMYICIYVYMYICIYVYMYICVYVYMCICVYVYMCICVYVYIQWEFQDPKMEVLYHIRPYFMGMFPYIGIT